jgi:hypothetical protein
MSILLCPRGTLRNSMLMKRACWPGVKVMSSVLLDCLDHHAARK